MNKIIYSVLIKEHYKKRVIIIDIVDMLMSFSLTRQEAVIYIVLLTEGSLTGYEASKMSAISRSNSYTTLASLVVKGAANIIEDSATRYAPVPIDEFCQNKIRELKNFKENLSTKIPKTKEETDGYITIKGKKHINDKIINLISLAKERIYISVGASLFDEIKPYLLSAIKRELKVVIITNPLLEMEGAIIYREKKQLTQIRIISDSTDVLTGDINDTGSCLYSKKQNLVDLFKDTMKNEIRLIELGEL